MEKFVVIMAGGVGSRFWPRSRKKSPKQLLNIVGQTSMIQQTYERVKDFVNPDHVLVITNKVQKALIEEQLPEIPDYNIIAEPIGKNTAPCVGLAAKVISEISDDAVFITLPADHLIKDRQLFVETLELGSKFAYESKGLLTFGIQPTRPETGYGYINFDNNEVDHKIFKVNRFVEKPNIEKAKKYLQSGDYFWNSGMFIWRADVILEEFKQFLPDAYQLLNEIDCEISNSKFNTVLNEIYPKFNSISIDYGIMEKSDKVYVVKGEFDWSDVGSWETAYELNEKDDAGNAVNGDVYLYDTKNSYVHSPNKFTAVIGAENFVIINTNDALLVCKREKTQDVKKVVDFLNENNRNELT